MFCSNCGKQLEDGVNFCKYCGAPTSHPEMPVSEPAGTPSKKHENRVVPEQPAITAKSTKTKVRRNVVLPVALIAVIAVVAGVLFLRNMGGNGASASQSYAIPELPDVLGLSKYDDNGNYSNYYVEGQALVSVPDNYYGWDVQMAEDGTMAMRSYDGNGFLIYRAGEKIGEIPSPVEYYYLCGSGEKIVYGTNNENSYLWDISAGKSSLISDTYRSWGISYDGSTLDMGQYYSKNGQELIWAINPVMSPDGKYVYCLGLWHRTETDETNEYYVSVSVIINGTSHTVFEGDLEPDGYYPYCNCIAYSKDYKEILFSVHNDIYYFSVENAADTGFEAQYVENVSGGYLLPMEQVTYFNLSTDGDTGPWGNRSFSLSNNKNYRVQKSIQNGVFLQLKEQNGIRSAAIVRLTENRLIELIPNVTGNVCLSADETKLWCVADGKLAFCDLASESPRAVYCDTAYVRAYGEYGEVGVSGDWMDNQWAIGSVPIAVTSDGETAYFISVDGSLWMCTPDTIRSPQFITDRAFWVQCSADNMFYLMKGDSYEYFEGRACDLYSISTTGEMDYQYSNVVDMYMTKSDVYISVGEDRSDGTYHTDIICALYCITDGGYRLICDNYYADDVYLRWWGD